jgi:glutathione S-transferase
VRRRQSGERALRLLDRHLAAHPFLVGERYCVADIALYGYVHVAGEAGIEIGRYANVAAWLERVRSRPGHINHLQACPPNARAGARRSHYE